MGYWGYRSYRRRRKYPRPSYAETQARAKQRLSDRFGGIDDDVMAAFLALPPEAFERFLMLYAERYGEGAARYARRAYRDWQQGAKTVSKMILERLLEVAPLVFTFQTKLELYRQVRSHYRLRPEHVRIRISGPAEIGLVEETADRIVRRAQTQPLPADVDSRLAWLSQGDGMVARQLVATVEEQEGAMIASAARYELNGLMSALDRYERIDNAEHVITLPYGTITVEVTKWKGGHRMAGEQDGGNQNLPAQRGQVHPPARDIIDFAVQQGGSEQIVLAAQQEALRLAGKQREAEMNSAYARRELSEFLEQAEEASRLSGVDYDAQADFRRASGVTRINVKRRRRWWWPF